MKQVDSSSEFQTNLEEMLFYKIKESLGSTSLSRNVILTVNQSGGVHVVPDFYSEEEHIIGEIHSHAGKLKSAQLHKIASDVLKMLLYEKTSGLNFDKYIVVCDKEEYDQLLGKSALAESLRCFGVTVLLFELDNETREQLRKVMNAQSFI